MVSENRGHGGGSGESAPDGPLLCFDRRAVGDVVVGPHKVLGSAQRRLSGSVLQHGSLLLRQCDQAGQASTRPGLAELSPGTVPVDALVRRWLETLASSLEMTCVFAGPFLVDGRAARVAERAERFRSAAWLGRR